MPVPDTQQGGQQASTYAELNEHATIAGVDGKKVFVVGSDGNQVGLATDDALMLLRDIRKYLRASAYMDVGQRQIVKIGALGNMSGGAEVTTTIPVSGSVTATVASTTITAVGGFDARFQAYDLARVKYATGMRANLSFS